MKETILSWDVEDINLWLLSQGNWFVSPFHEDTDEIVEVKKTKKGIIVEYNYFHPTNFCQNKHGIKVFLPKG